GLLKNDAQLLISRSAHVIFPWHKLIDSFREKVRGGAAIGTTGRGIGPAYEDKAARNGIRVGDLLHPERLHRRVSDRISQALDELRELARVAKQPVPQ